MKPIDTSTSQYSAVDSTVRTLASGLDANGEYLLTTTTNALVKQGTAWLITATTFANMANGDTVTITDQGVSVVYEFRKTGSVTAGNILVDIAGLTTAAQVATALYAAIVINQSAITATDNTGSITLQVTTRTGLVVAENVVNAAFTVALTAPVASAASGSVIVAAGQTIMLLGRRGGQVGITRVSADGAATLVKVNGR